MVRPMQISVELIGIGWNLPEQIELPKTFNEMTETKIYPLYIILIASSAQVFIL